MTTHDWSHTHVPNAAAATALIISAATTTAAIFLTPIVISVVLITFVALPAYGVVIMWALQPD